MKKALLSILLPLPCLAQTPFCNLSWEANDGSGWTRNQLVTTHRDISVRYVADWWVPGAGSGAYFGGTDFDATISHAQAGDSVNSFVRPPTFFIYSRGSTRDFASFRFGDLVKIDSTNDLALPGQGTGWVSLGQTIDGFPPPPVDHSTSIPIFSYSLTLDDVAGQREISCASRIISSHNHSVSIYGPNNSAQYFFSAPSSDMNVTYIPTPSCFAVISTASLVAMRRRRA